MPNKSSALTIPLGMGQNRHPTLIDFQRETTAHFLIGGTTGAGKTNAVHAIICTLLKRRPDEVKLILVDLKGIEFPQYGDCPHLLRPIVKDPGEVLELIQGLWLQVKERMDLLGLERGVNHVREYNARRKPSERLPYIITVFDELAIVMLDRTLKHKAEIESYLARIASVGRASGIHLVLATQRPDKNVLTPLITANFPGRIALACASVYDSMTIIGNGEACFDEAVPPGRAILSHGRFRVPFQVAFIRDDLRRSIIDDAEGGRFGVQRMTHDVTIDELAHYALENFSGNFAINKLWSQFRHRGITSQEIRELSRTYSVERFYMEDGEYILTQSAKRQPWIVTKVVGDQGPRAEDLRRQQAGCQMSDEEKPPEQPTQESEEDDAEYQKWSARVQSELEGVPNVE
jgi:hypothetical protein